MNQTRNLIQWKNLTNEEEAGFDFDGYKYESKLTWIGEELKIKWGEG